MQHEEAAETNPVVVTDDEDDDCCCIHWDAATIIQKPFRGWLVFLCYKEFQQYQIEMALWCYQIYISKVRADLRLQRQWRI
jgi:hypothetical protein